MKQTKTRKAPSAPLTPEKFRSILRSVSTASQTGRTIASVAERQGVSVETVNTVRRTGTWSEFVKYKQSLRAKRGSYSAPKKVRPSVVAKDAAREGDPKTFTITKEDLDKLARIEHLVTNRLSLVPKLESRLSHIEDRVDTHAQSLRSLSSWVNTIDTRLSALRSRAVKWPFGRR